MGQPGMPSVSGEDWLVREVQNMRRELQELKAANVFGMTGIRPRDGGTEFDGYVTINGPAKITGALDLPAGIIGNDSLANPFLTDTSSIGINNYAISTTSTVRATLTFVVPAGFTQAVIIANPTAMGYNNTTSPDYLYVQAVVNGVNSGEMYSAAPAGLGVGLAAPFHTTLTGLSGGNQITVGVATRTSTAAWSASGSNQANIYATALWLR